MVNLEPILEHLAQARQRLLRAADSISPEQWKTVPRQGGWSTAEVVAHLLMVERSVIATADKLRHKTPRRFPPHKRLHLPLLFLEIRLIRGKTPIPLDPALVRDKEELFADLRTVRKRTLAFIKETAGRDLSVYRWPHPFIGSLNTYEWFAMISRHERRHAKQIRDISTGLPKAIEDFAKMGQIYH